MHHIDKNNYYCFLNYDDSLDLCIIGYKKNRNNFNCGGGSKFGIRGLIFPLESHIFIIFSFLNTLEVLWFVCFIIIYNNH